MNKKLNPEKACAVVAMVRSGMTAVAVAAKVGVTKSAVSDVMSGRNWSRWTGITNSARQHERLHLGRQADLRSHDAERRRVVIKLPHVSIQHRADLA